MSPTSSPSAAGTIRTRAPGRPKAPAATAARAGASIRSPCPTATLPPTTINDGLKTFTERDTGDGERVTGVGEDCRGRGIAGLGGGRDLASAKGRPALADQRRQRNSLSPRSAAARALRAMPLPDAIPSR